MWKFAASILAFLLAVMPAYANVAPVQSPLATRAADANDVRPVSSVPWEAWYRETVQAVNGNAGELADFEASVASELAIIDGRLDALEAVQFWDDAGSGKIVNNNAGAVQIANGLQFRTGGSNYLTLSHEALGADRTVTFQDAAGTVYVTGGVDVAIADGGTGLSTLPGTNEILQGNGANAYTLTAAPTLTSLAVGDAAYGAGWNGSLLVPTRNAIYDYLSALEAAINASLSTLDGRIDALEAASGFWESGGGGAYIINTNSPANVLIGANLGVTGDIDLAGGTGGNQSITFNYDAAANDMLTFYENGGLLYMLAVEGVTIHQDYGIGTLGATAAGIYFDPDIVAWGTGGSSGGGMVGGFYGDYDDLATGEGPSYQTAGFVYVASFGVLDIWADSVGYLFVQ